MVHRGPVQAAAVFVGDAVTPMHRPLAPVALQVAALASHRVDAAVTGPRGIVPDAAAEQGAGGRGRIPPAATAELVADHAADDRTHDSRCMRVATSPDVFGFLATDFAIDRGSVNLTDRLHIDDSRQLVTAAAGHGQAAGGQGGGHDRQSGEIRIHRSFSITLKRLVPALGQV